MPNFVPAHVEPTHAPKDKGRTDFTTKTAPEKGAAAEAIGGRIALEKRTQSILALITPAVDNTERPALGEKKRAAALIGGRGYPF
jgi:hypothetical protein